MAQSTTVDGPAGADSTTSARTSGRPTIELASALGTAAARYPDNLAVVDDRTELTYRELDRAVAASAEILRGHRVGAGTRIAVLLPRGAAAVIAIHAAVRLGAVVAPADPNDPDARLTAAFDGARISHVLVGARDRERLAPLLFGTPVEVTPGVFLATRTRTAAGDPTDPPTARPGYLLFTSGSTGVPRGVLLGHPAVAHFAGWAARRLALTPADRVAAQSALTFDLSTFDLFSTAMAGAAQVLLPDWIKPFPADFVDWLAEQRISVIYAVPSLLRGIPDAGGTRAGLPALRTIAYAGEPYPERALDELLRALAGTVVHNFYGPTETNVCTAELVSRNRVPGTAVSVGTAITGVSVCVVDDRLSPTDGGGELVVAGPTLLDGYLVAGQVADPCVEVRFPDGVTRRAYRTGDRATAGADGRIYLGGRFDAQVKRNGFRIDLAGLQATAATVPGVRGCAAVAVGSANTVVLFLESDTGAARSADDLVAAVDAELRRVHSARHCPNRIEAVARIPRNGRGKVDHGRLRALAAGLDDEQSTRHEMKDGNR